MKGNERMKTKLKLRFSVILFAAAMVSGCSAIGDKAKQNLLGAEGGGGSATPEGPGMKVSAAPLESGAVAVNNFRQILGSVSSTVGIVPPPECVALFRNSATTFPKYGEAKELTAPEESNKVALAACVCNGLFVKESDPANSAKRIFLKGADFVNGSTPVFLTGTVGDRLVKSAWGRAADSGEQSLIQGMVSAISANNPAGQARSPAELLQVRFNSMCTIVLASYEAQAK